MAIFFEAPRKQIVPSPYIQEVIQEHEAKCNECGADLGVGDYLDNFFPWFTENNLCEKCSKEEY